MIWHNATFAEVEAELNTNISSGLTTDEANLRLKEYGLNELKTKKPTTFINTLINEFNDFFNISILVIAVVNYILALAVNLQKSISDTYPNLCRSINLRNVPFNQQLSSGYLLLEVGTSANTLDEALRSARAFAQEMARVITASI